MYYRGGKSVKRYWELEQPIIYSSDKNVVKVYMNQGKIQVFPSVPSSKYGIGRGATLDLHSFSNERLIDLRESIMKIFENTISK